jgi:hypothetical protein
MHVGVFWDAESDDHAESVQPIVLHHSLSQCCTKGTSLSLEACGIHLETKVTVPGYCDPKERE